MYFWCHFARRSPACIKAEAESQVAGIAMEKVGEAPIRVSRLPYAAEPRINCDDKRLDIPFCWKPESCAGHSACPRNPSCTS